MKLTTAFEKIIKAHGDETYATVTPASGEGYDRRLDLEYAIHLRDEYELIGVRGGSLPLSEKSYRLSQEQPLLPDWSIVQYTIYRDCEPDYYVTVCKKYRYEDYEWTKTFNDTLYPKRTDRPWWRSKEFN